MAWPRRGSGRAQYPCGSAPSARTHGSAALQPTRSGRPASTCRSESSASRGESAQSLLMQLRASTMHRVAKRFITCTNDTGRGLVHLSLKVADCSQLSVHCGLHRAQVSAAGGVGVCHRQRMVEALVNCRFHLTAWRRDAGSNWVNSRGSTFQSLALRWRTEWRDERFDNLQARHAELDKQIRNEESRRVPDEVALHAMKKGKLAVKDQMAGNVA